MLCLDAYLMLYNCDFLCVCFLLQCCFVDAIHRLIKNSFYCVIIWILFYWWARQVVQNYTGYKQPYRIGLAFAIITINRPLSLLQICLDPEYGILMEFWDPSHYSVTFSPSSSFSPKLMIEDPLVSGMNNDSSFFHSNFETEAVFKYINWNSVLNIFDCSGGGGLINDAVVTPYLRTLLTLPYNMDFFLYVTPKFSWPL